MDLLDQMHRTAFLGAEFLTWLWYRAEVHDGEFEFDPEFGAFDVYFEDKLVVGSAIVDAQENHFKGGHPASSLEAHSALRLGKLAHEAKLRITRGSQEWQFAFKAQSFTLAGIKIPAVLSKEDDERFAERMLLVEQLDTMWAGLFGAFLEARLGDAWAAETLPAIRGWVSGHSASDEEQE